MSKNLNNFLNLMKYVMNETLMTEFLFNYKLERSNSDIVLNFYFFRKDKNSEINLKFNAVNMLGKDLNFDFNNFNLTDQEYNDIWTLLINNVNNFKIEKIKN